MKKKNLSKTKEYDVKKKIEKMSAEYAKALKEFSELEIKDIKTNLDLLRKLRESAISQYLIMSGAFNNEPKPYTVNALNSLSSRITDLTEKLEEAIDFETLAKDLYTEVIQNSLEKLLLHYGSAIQDEVSRTSGSEKKIAFIKKYSNKLYKQFAVILQQENDEIKKKVIKYLIKHTS